MIEQRPGLAEDGVGRGERQARDVLIHARAFAGLAVIHIHVLSRRVCPDDVEVLARSEVLVTDPGRDDDHVARADGFDDARLAAQLHPGRTAENQQRLVRRAVIVVIVKTPLRQSSPQSFA